MYNIKQKQILFSQEVNAGYLFHFFNHSREISGNTKPHALRNKIERVRDRDQHYKREE